MALDFAILLEANHLLSALVEELRYISNCDYYDIVIAITNMLTTKKQIVQLDGTSSLKGMLHL